MVTLAVITVAALASNGLDSGSELGSGLMWHHFDTTWALDMTDRALHLPGGGLGWVCVDTGSNRSGSTAT